MVSCNCSLRDIILIKKSVCNCKSALCCGPSEPCHPHVGTIHSVGPFEKIVKEGISIFKSFYKFFLINFLPL